MGDPRNADTGTSEACEHANYIRAAKGVHHVGKSFIFRHQELKTVFGIQFLGRPRRADSRRRGGGDAAALPTLTEVGGENNSTIIFPMLEAFEHCPRGASIWQFATNDNGAEPDVVLACAGDVPTIEICATSWLLQKHVPGIKVRVVNVIDLTALMMADDHPHGMDNMSFDALFTAGVPVIFAFHNNRWLIHTIVHGRSNEARFHVRGYMDRGTTTTPFDMVVLNEMSRFHLAIDALNQVPRLRASASRAIEFFRTKLYEHTAYIREHLEDMPEIRNWHWTADFSDPSAPPLAKGHPRAALFSDS